MEEEKEAKKKEKDVPSLVKEKESKGKLLKLRGLLKPSKKLEAEGEIKKLEKEKKPGKEAPALIEDPFTILKFVLMTEKAIQLIEKENKLVFIVDRKSSKDDVRRAAESAFQTSVDEVKTMIDQKARKKAFIRFKEAGVAGDIAMRLGII